MSSSWTSLPVFSGQTLFARIFSRNSLILPGLCLLVFALSGCGESPSYSSRSSQDTTLTAPPPGAGQRPLEPGQLGRPLGPDGLPTLEEPKGVNVSVDTLFSADIKDPIERIKRLENAVLELRRDYDATLPSIKRLVSVEKDLQKLMGQLEILTNSEPDVAAAPLSPVTESTAAPSPAPHANSAMPPAAPPAAASPTHDPTPLVPAVPEARSQQVSPEAAKPLAASALSTAPATAPVDTPAKTLAAPPPSATPPKPPPPESSALAGLDVRIGVDGGKTRLVIDLNGSAKHRADLDDEEKILVIEINGAEWKGPASKHFSSSVIKSYTTQPLENGKGTRLIATLKEPVRMVMNTLLAPESGGKNYRLVIDLRK